MCVGRGRGRGRGGGGGEDKNERNKKAGGFQLQRTTLRRSLFARFEMLRLCSDSKRL